MSATTANALPPQPPALPRLVTIAEFALLPSETPTGTVRHELDDGRVVVMPLPGKRHSKVSTNIIFYFTTADRAGHGEAHSDVGVILRRNPDRLVGPDACFIARASLPSVESPEGFLETMPDIVAEVRSKNDTLAELQRKANEYLAAGVKIVWLIDPIRGNAVVNEAGQAPRTLAATDVLPTGGVIPNADITVGDVLRI